MTVGAPSADRARAHAAGTILAAALSLAACHTQIRFDDHSFDAGEADGARPQDPHDGQATQDAPPPGPSNQGSDAGLTCREIRCGYEVAACSADSCEMECPEHGRCTGLCGPQCTTDCEEDSQCTLVTGHDARIRCEPGATCLLTLGQASEGRCERGSHCDIVCLGTCALLCDLGATCSFSCSSNLPPASFAGRASCP